MQLTSSLIKQQLLDVIFQRGVDYQQRGMVLNLEYDMQQGRVISQVQSASPSKIYNIHINLNDSGVIKGLCSCPTGYNCKHVAATLMQIIEERQPELMAQKMTAEQLQQRVFVAASTAAEKEDGISKWQQAWQKKMHKTPHVPDKNPVESRLVYLCKVDAQQRLELKLYVSRCLKKGGYGKPRAYEAHSNRASVSIDPQEQMLLSQLLGQVLLQERYGAYYSGRPIHLEMHNAEEILNGLLATQRCFWEKIGQTALFLGQKQDYRVAWRVENNQQQSLQFAIRDRYDVPLFSLGEQIWYYDSTHHCIGKANGKYSAEVLRALFHLPKIGIENIELTSQILKQLSEEVGQSLPLPETLPVKISNAVKPQPKLTVSTLDTDDDYFGYDPDTGEPTYQLCLSVKFSYEGIEIPFYHATNPIIYMEGEVTRSISRDFPAEQEYLNDMLGLKATPVEFYDYGDESAGKADPYFASDLILVWGFVAEKLLTEDGVKNYLQEKIDPLRKKGWQVVYDWESLPIDLDVEPDAWYSDLKDAQDNGWFELEIGVEINGEKSNILPAIVTFLAQQPYQQTLLQLQKSLDEHTTIQLEDGRNLKIPSEQLYRIIQTLFELYDPKSLTKDNKLLLSQLRAAQAVEISAAFAKTQLRWYGNTKLRDLGQRLCDAKFPNVLPDKNFSAELRPYQQIGLNWLQFLREYQLGGILADDMGLGKTVQTLAHIQLEKAAGRLQQPCLVVAPTSLMHNWQREAALFSPNLKVAILQGPERQCYFKRLADFDILLTTYPLIHRDKEHLIKQDYYYLILDEAQFAKNARSKSYLVLQQLNTQHRLCLTGTPIENHLGEMWALFHFLMPGLLGNNRQFKKLFRTPIEQQQDHERQKVLNKRLALFILRRTKQAVLPELPKKTEIIREVELSGEQRDLYESIRMAMDTKVRKIIAQQGAARSQIIILDALLKLRQICCSPQLLSLEKAKKVTQSAKLDLLFSLLPQLLEEGRRILLFSSFRKMLDLIAQRCQQEEIPFVKLTGNTTDRQTPIEAFQNKEVPLFLISLKAGGTGLNLTAADTIIHYDPWWNPAAENQATDRAHRIGQDKPVFVYKLITKGTVEEKILELQKRKQALLDGLMSDKENTNINSLGQKDVENLFSRLEEV